jgi:serine/threonine protein kinase
VTSPSDLGAETGPGPEFAHLEALLSTAGESGRYHVISRVGAGGMGVVYKAMDTRLNRAVAIKAILSGPGRVAETTARLRKEAKAAASLDHPYICRVYELIETGSEQLIVMEFVDGETLSAILSRGIPPLALTIQLGIEIAEGLANAHEHGLVHRDLKPANVMVTPHGHIKLLDFGLARTDWSSSPSAETQTQSSAPPHDAFAGTPRYMAPEQAEGRPVTAQTDVFSLGVLLFECVTGKLPFTGANRYEYVYHLRSDPPTPVRKLAPNTPEDLARLIDACLHRTPANRPGRCSSPLPPGSGFFRARRQLPPGKPARS